ncbi:cathepsin B-like [Culex quinquefasciatus]|uniref:cathepsin B-like n=1 Tax=Culex quinquefasciatus TaxID=7176 RepID=UPI0018E3CAEF|nr:cathepsin B-like [Culex quinquefasciatus]
MRDHQLQSPRDPLKTAIAEESIKSYDHQSIASSLRVEMNPITVVLSGLLLASAVAAGSNNAARRRNPYSSGSDSSEEYNRYSGSMYRPQQQQQQQGKYANQAVYGNFPVTFDARDYWAQCPSVGRVPDQGCCDSSYALVPTAVMTDRTCIATNSSNMVFSAFDVISCCADCPIYQKDKCRGGDPVAVWKYWNKVGIVNEDCLPYTFTNSCIGQDCPIRCVPGASGTVAFNKKKGLEYYTVMPNVQQIQNEIFKNGPVEASIDMFLDFATFSGEGVYIHRNGPYLNKHSVKIIGWGNYNETPYWLIVNTFGHGWGDEGIAKILRGQNHLNIETSVRAAMPNY